MMPRSAKRWLSKPRQFDLFQGITGLLLLRSKYRLILTTYNVVVLSQSLTVRHTLTGLAMSGIQSGAILEHAAGECHGPGHVLLYHIA